MKSLPTAFARWTTAWIVFALLAPLAHGKFKLRF